MSGLRDTMRDVRAWVDDRVGLLDELEELGTHKQVPVHRHTLWYYLGGMTLFLFIVQVATGVLLLFYYRPNADGAYESIQFLMTSVNFGWLVRSIHHWGANLMIFTLYIHMFSVLLLGAYRKPREVTWLSGALLLGLTLTLGFTGYLLPWNELSYFATTVGTRIVGVIPVVGSFFLRVLRGGTDVTGATLTRFYALHTAVLPALVFLVLALHVYLVQKHGMSVPPEVEHSEGSGRSIPFLPDFLLRDLVGWLAALAILAALAAFLPAELGSKADPFASAPTGIKPEWYFMFMFQSLKYLPAHILGMEGEAVGIMGFGVAGLLLLLIPFLDRPAIRGRRPHLVRWLGVAMIVFIIVMTILGYTMSPEA